MLFRSTIGATTGTAASPRTIDAGGRVLQQREPSSMRHRRAMRHTKARARTRARTDYEDRDATVSSSGGSASLLPIRRRRRNSINQEFLRRRQLASTEPMASTSAAVPLEAASHPPPSIEIVRQGRSFVEFAIVTAQNDTARLSIEEYDAAGASSSNGGGLNEKNDAITGEPTTSTMMPMKTDLT